MHAFWNIQNSQSILIIYRHSDDMINRLERAGLGYHVNSDETDDKLGKLKN